MPTWSRSSKGSTKSGKANGRFSVYLLMFRFFIEKQIRRKLEPYRGIDGWLTDEEALGLYRLASKLPPDATVVEIGSWQGKSTFCLASGLRSGKVHAIDPFDASGGFDVRSEKEYMEKKAGHDLLARFRENMTARRVMDKIVVRQGVLFAVCGRFQSYRSLVHRRRPFRARLHCRL